MGITRRRFLKTTAAAGTVVAFAKDGLALKTLQPVVEIGNPLESYPPRDWEKIYRDQYRYDRTFTYICSPNDTHACRMKAFVRNGVVMRAEQNYDVENYSDLYGNKATPNWHPRGCLKGFTFHRRVYGPYRLKYPIVRKGWKQWADDGFPELTTDDNKKKYKFDSRGTDEFIRLSWDKAEDYIARGFINIATRYSGEEGAKRLTAQGYEPEMIKEMKGAGTMTFKLRGGMGLLGVIGKYGMYRLSNTLALLDANIRKVDHEHALGGRTWSNYTWHGDQAPGHPYVHGVQASEIDLNDLRSTKLHIQVGKNLVENKM
ncbi:MAG: Nitrate oxidoreductase alpha subunit NarG, partial [Candidatus Gottesmanbacteria bacterium GW2011_GWC2_39_8]